MATLDALAQLPAQQAVSESTCTWTCSWTGVTYN